MAFTPANYGTCILHMRASAAGVSDGAGVSSATVLTGTNLTGQTGGNPTYDATSLLNNRPGIVYSRTGTDDGMYSASDYLTGSTTAAFAAVCRFAELDATAQYLFAQTIPALRLWRLSLSVLNGGILSCVIGTDTALNTFNSAGSTIVVDTNYIIVGTLTLSGGGTTGTLQVRVNNSLVIDTAVVLGTSLLNTSGIWMGVGYDPSTSSLGMGGCLNELAIMSTAWTTAQAVDVYSHLYNDYLTPAVQCPPQTVVMS